MNIAHLIEENARTFPSKKSVIFTKKEKIGFSYPFYTFKEFDDRSQKISQELFSRGVKPGMRVCLFVKPSLDFSVIVFSLFKMGAIPVLIDPGMGVKALLNAIKDVKPEVLIAEKIVHIIRFFRPSYFKSVIYSLTPQTLLASLSQEAISFETLKREFDDHAAILFTSGGTGRPKGVIYTHGMLHTQTKLLKEMYALNPTDIDLPGFPLFALFTLAMGMTSVIPPMNPAKPSEADPKSLVSTILDQQCTFLAGSPAIWKRVVDYCEEKQVQLPNVKHLVMFGAPVDPDLLIRLSLVLPFGKISTPYGATECLPVSLIFSDEILNRHLNLTKNGHGVCVGYPVAGVKVLIDKDADIPDFLLPDKGEILVKASQQTPGYFEKNEETKLVKTIINGELFHRMGDMGVLDKNGCLWFLGRKVHQVHLEDKSYSPISVESFFNQHPKITRVAFVQDHNRSALVVEEKGMLVQKEELLLIIKEILELSPYKNLFSKVCFYPSFPVDVRHNIKIDRKKLSLFAQQEKGYFI